MHRAQRFYTLRPVPGRNWSECEINVFACYLPASRTSERARVNYVDYYARRTAVFWGSEWITTRDDHLRNLFKLEKSECREERGPSLGRPVPFLRSSSRVHQHVAVDRFSVTDKLNTWDISSGLKARDCIALRHVVPSTVPVFVGRNRASDREARYAAVAAIVPRTVPQHENVSLFRPIIMIQIDESNCKLDVWVHPT